jgi:hypothetical protein
MISANGLDRPHALLRHRRGIGVGVKARLGEAERQGALGVGLLYGELAFGNRASGETRAQNRVAAVIVQALRATALDEED